LIAELERAIRASGQPLRVVAARADLPERTLSRIIRRQVDPKLYTLQKIAEVLGCELVLVSVHREDRP
jgi:DNA-binding phage protein